MYRDPVMKPLSREGFIACPASPSARLDERLQLRTTPDHDRVIAQSLRQLGALRLGGEAHRQPHGHDHPVHRAPR